MHCASPSLLVNIPQYLPSVEIPYMIRNRLKGLLLRSNSTDICNLLPFHFFEQSIFSISNLLLTRLRGQDTRKVDVILCLDIPLCSFTPKPGSKVNSRCPGVVVVYTVL